LLEEVKEAIGDKTHQEHIFNRICETELELLVLDEKLLERGQQQQDTGQLHQPTKSSIDALAKSI